MKTIAKKTKKRILSWDELREMFQETGKMLDKSRLQMQEEHCRRMQDIDRKIEATNGRIKETEKRIKEIDKSIEKSKEERIKEAERRKEEAERREEERIKEAERRKEEAERREEERIKEAERRKEEDRRKEEIERRMRRTDEQVDRTCAKIAEMVEQFTSTTGHISEGLMEPASVRIFQEAGYDIDRYYRNLKKKNKNNQTEMEVDLLMLNGTLAIAVEIKTDCRKKDIDHFLRQMPNFKKLYPEYRNKEVLAAVAALNYEREAAEYAHEQGLLVIRTADGDNFTLDPSDRKSLKRF
ncbi:MAG: hypothetical protein CW341_07545 [Bacteroidetes bacterium]|nr:hypothetical protein [Bacteroidota bacterium]